MNESDKGKIKYNRQGSVSDWASAKGWTIRAIAKQVQEMANDPKALARCIDKAVGY